MNDFQWLIISYCATVLIASFLAILGVLCFAWGWWMLKFYIGRRDK